MKSSLPRLIEASRMSCRCVRLGTLCGLLVAMSPAVAQVEPAYSAGRYVLSIDGESAGFVRKVSGGTIKAEVVTQSVGPEYIVKKHIATIKHEPFEMKIGMGMGKGVYEWIAQSFEKDFERRTGAIHATDSNYEALSRREFFDALITEVTIPALDAGSKEPAYMTVKFAPEEIVYKKGDRLQTGSSDGLISPKAKQWMCSNFAVDFPGMPATRVQKIDSFTIKQVVREADPGQVRPAAPTSLELPNLKLTISMADIEPWQDWFHDFVIDGNCSDADELDGSIIFLAPDLKEDLGRIELLGVGIVSLEMDAAEANQEEVARVAVELYVEAISFEYSADEDDGDTDDNQKDDAGR